MTFSSALKCAFLDISLKPTRKAYHLRIFPRLAGYELKEDVSIQHVPPFLQNQPQHFKIQRLKSSFVFNELFEASLIFEVV